MRMVRDGRAMQRRAVPVLLAVIAMLSATLWAQSVSPESRARGPVEEIRALEKAFSEAIFHGDASAYANITAVALQVTRLAEEQR